MPTADADTFNTMDVRPRNEPRLNNEEVFSRSSNAAGIPRAIGLTSLDIDKGADIRIKAFADTVTQDSVKVHLDSWGDTVLYSAGCTWLDGRANASDFQFGNFSTLDDHPWDKPQMQTSCKIEFPKPFHGSMPKVIVWLNELHMTNSVNWRCKAYTTNITADSFVIHIDTWSNTKLYSATASWIAYPSTNPNIASGSFNTMDVRPWFLPQLTNQGAAKFGTPFQSTPRVLAALDWLDIGNACDLRLKLVTSDISPEGLTWNLDAWNDTILYSAGASYIAIMD